MKFLADLPSVNSLDAKGKVVFVRIDVNGSLLRLKKSVDTIKLLRKKGARIVLMAHLGRPKGIDTELSLKPICRELSSISKIKINFLETSSGDNLVKAVEKLSNKDVLMMENVRFDPREDHPISSLVRQWAVLCDAYVFDGFAVSHRETGSTVGLSRIGIPSYAGLLHESEVLNLSACKSKKLKKPAVLLIGGKKADSKIEVIENFLDKVGAVIIGGAVSHTFLKALGTDVGDSYIQEEFIDAARKIAAKAKAKKVDLYLPIDYSWNKENAIMDIGPETIKVYSDLLSKAKSIIWNGAMGVTSIKEFEIGTKTISKIIAKTKSKGGFVVVGGGDTVESLERFKIPSSKFTHVSTGGGAMIAFLAEK